LGEQIIYTSPLSKSKGIFITLLISLLIGGIYTGIRLLLPQHGLTGYYLYPSEVENAVLHPINVSPLEIRSGLNKKVYEGNPDGRLIEEITEDRPIYFDWHSDAKKSYKSPFIIEWNGLLKIEYRGDYTFVLGSDDGSELFLNDRIIIDNGGVHGLLEKRRAIFLEPGFYRFHLRYFDQGGGAVLYLKWKFSDEDETVILPSQFYQETNTQNLNTVDTTIPYALGIEPHSIIKETNIVFKKNNPNIIFTNNGILRTYYVNYWDNDRFEPPVNSPPYNIIWRGFIWIPKDGAYAFDVVTDGDVFLFVDSRPVIKYYEGKGLKKQVSMERGWKPVQINYYNTGKYATLNLLWQKPSDNKLVSVSSRYLMPAEDIRFFRGMRLWCGVGFILASAFIISGLFLAPKNTIAYLRGYIAYLKGNWSIAALIVVVIFGAVLRLNNYSLVPPHGDTMDVYQEAWNGFHILHGKGPQSWEHSFFIPAYNSEETKYFQWFDDSFTIVSGYIAHPPLFSIFAAIPPIICGAKDYLDCRLTTINLVPIFFSTLTIVLVFLVSYKIYRSTLLSIIASILYATVPYFVVAGRIAKGDVLLSLVLIVGVLCVLKYAESKRGTYIIFAGLLAGVSFWCKETGICAILIFPLLLGRNGFVKQAFIVCGIGIFVAAGYVVYNYMINPDAFFKILSLRNEFQQTAFDVVIKYLMEPKITDKYAGFGVGYLLWFWFAIIYSIGKRNSIVPTTAFIYLMTLCALSRKILSYGWFLMPVFPFMAIAGGVFLKDFISRPNTARAILLLLVPLAIPLKEVLPENFINSPWLFRGYLAVGLIPFLVVDFFRHRITESVARVSCYTYISIFIVINVYIIYYLPDIYKPFG
jgi:4-amino-4-deoxy-L-arabinose transferase-like glycosyltransferase